MLPFGFGGGWRSEVTGLVHFGARWYSPALGQFMSRDPLGAVDSFNLYAYAGFDPINFWDPSGLSASNLARPVARAQQNGTWGGATFDGISLVSVDEPSDGWFSRIGARWDDFSSSVVRKVRLGEIVHDFAASVQAFLGRESSLKEIDKDYTAVDNSRNELMGDLADDGVRKGLEIARDVVISKGAAGVLGGVGGLVAKDVELERRVLAKNLPPLRKQSVDSIERLKSTANSMRAAGASSEEIARVLHAERNLLKVKYRELSPSDMVRVFERRNFDKYGDPIGPSIDQLRESGKSWEQIMESAMRAGGEDLGF